MKTLLTTSLVAGFAAVFMFASTGVSEAAKKKAAAAAPKICYEFWAPVCAKKGKATQTYANTCKANVAGAKVVSQGVCKK
jgi:hypothetical protein